MDGRWLYVFGGLHVSSKTCFNDVFCLDVQKFHWYDMTTKNQQEKNKDSQRDTTSESSKKEDRLEQHKQHRAAQSRSSSFSSIGDTKEDRDWVMAAAAEAAAAGRGRGDIGRAPPERTGHTAVAVKDLASTSKVTSIYIFGGSNPRLGLMNDMHVLDIPSYDLAALEDLNTRPPTPSWRQLAQGTNAAVLPKAPTPREAHTMVLSGHTLYVVRFSCVSISEEEHFNRERLEREEFFVLTYSIYVYHHHTHFILLLFSILYTCTQKNTVWWKI